MDLIDECTELVACWPYIPRIDLFLSTEEEIDTLLEVQTCDRLYQSRQIGRRSPAHESTEGHGLCSDWHGRNYYVGAAIDHRDGVADEIGHINKGSSRVYRDPKRARAHRHRRCDSVRAGISDGDGVGGIVRHIDERPRRIDRDSNRLCPYRNGRDDRIRSSIDHRDGIAGEIRRISESSSPVDRDAPQTHAQVTVEITVFVAVSITESVLLELLAT